MVDGRGMVRVATLGDEPKLGRFFMPRTACTLPSGDMVIAEHLYSRLPIVSPDGTLVRHMVPEDRAFDTTGAVVLDDDGAALFVVVPNAITKLRFPTGAEVAKYQAPKDKTCYTHAALIGGVLYVLDHRNSCVVAFDPATLKPRNGGTFGKPAPGAKLQTEDDYAKPAPPASGNELVEPCAIRAHPDGCMVVDCRTKRILVFDLPTGKFVRDYTGFSSPFDALVLDDSTLMVADNEEVVLVDLASGARVHASRVRPAEPSDHPFLNGLVALPDGTVGVLEALPKACVHIFSVSGVNERLSGHQPRPDVPLITPRRAETYDVCVVGAGAVGCNIARDVASCGYSVLLLERDNEVGGVWAKNKYPGLRLHAPGTSYRALSLAPAWQAHGLRVGEVDRTVYRPYQEEILSYIQSLTAHPKITVRTGATFCYADEAAGQRHRVVCDGFSALASAVVHATGTYEVTAGKPHAPFDVSAVTNGATIVHSSSLSEHEAAFKAAKRKFIVGASKAAIDVLMGLSPDDESILWTHRGHIIFTNRDNDMRALVKRAEEERRRAAAGEQLTASEVAASREAMAAGRTAGIGGTRTANMLLKQQMFSGYSKMYLGSGKGHTVGEPLSKSGIAQRGGIESEAGIAHCRNFIKRQRILERIEVKDGALHLVGDASTNHEVWVPGEGDVVVLCTGQRAEGFGFNYHRTCARSNTDGVFMPFAVSGTAMCIATYWVSLIVDYLDGTHNAYSDGRFERAAARVADHMEKIQDRSPWACFMTFLGTNQLDVAELVFPWEGVGAPDLSSSPHYFSWYGRDLDVRAATKMLKSREFDDSEMMAGLTGGTQLDGTGTPTELAVDVK